MRDDHPAEGYRALLAGLEAAPPPPPPPPPPAPRPVAAPAPLPPPPGFDWAGFWRFVRPLAACLLVAVVLLVLYLRTH